MNANQTRTMTRPSRWNWLLAPFGFGACYRLVLWLYWLPERRRWITAHGGDATSVAFGEGEFDGLTLLLTIDSLVLFAICCAFAPRARPRESLIIGGLTALMSAVFQLLLGRFFESKFGSLGSAVALRGIPITVACVLVVALAYSRSRRFVADNS
jgi:Na+-driven multidrug efflux pump